MLIYFFDSASSPLWSSWTMVASVAAAIAALAAWFQFRAMSLQMRASLLLSMDERWEEPSFRHHRRAYANFRHSVINEVRLYRCLPESSPDNEITMQRCRRRLELLQSSESPTYQEVMGICAFFETVGYSARIRYLRERDIVRLLGGSIREASQIFQYHIQDLQLVRGRERLLTNCVWLFDRAWDAYEREFGRTR